MQYLHEMTKKLCLWLPMALLALTTAYSQKPSEGVIQGLGDPGAQSSIC